MNTRETLVKIVRPDDFDPELVMDRIAFMVALKDLGGMFSVEILRQVFEEWEAGKDSL